MKKVFQSNIETAADGKTSLIGAAVFSAVYLFIVYWFQTADIWNRHFEGSGLYILYNLFRVVFLFYFAWIMFFLGRLFFVFIKGNEVQLEAIDFFLVSSFIGASLLTIAMFALGLLKLYYTLVLLLITTPIVFTSYTYLKELAQKTPDSIKGFFHEHFNKKGGLYKIISSAFIAIVLFQIFYIFVSRGLMPDLITNDTIGHYLPYYQEVINNHSIWMNKYFLHYYYSKGAGLFFLAGLLTDIQSSQIVSFYFLLLSILVLYAFIKRMMDNELLWMLLGIIMYLSSSILLIESGSIVAEFQKLHIVTGSFIIFIVSVTIVAFNLPSGKEYLLGIIQSIALISVTIMSPVSFIFTFPYLISQVFIFFKRKSLVRHSILPLSIAVTAFAAMLVFNYISAGLAEYSPVTFFFKHRNESIMKEWISPMAISFQVQMNTISGEGAGAVGIKRLLQANLLPENITAVLFDNTMIPFGVYLVLLLTAIVLIVIAVRKGLLPFEAVNNMLPILSMLIIAFLLIGIVEQHSIHRYLVFLSFFKAALYIYAMYFFAMVFTANDFKKYAAVLIAALSIYPIINFYSFSKQQILSRGEKINFLMGASSYANLYQKRWDGVNMGLKIQKAVGADKKVMVMNFLPPLYGLPKSGFQRPLMNDFNKSGYFEGIMFGSPEEAIKALKALDINHFLILLDQPLLFTAYAPLFEPQNIKRYFKLIGSSEKTLLLTWRFENEQGLSDEAVMIYNNLRESSRMHPYAQTYESMKGGRQGGS